MSITKVSIIVSTLAVAACGAKKDSSSTAPQKTEEAAKADGATLPAMAIVKVPVGADGKEMHDKAEMRLVSGEQKLSQENIAATFDAATAPATVIDELDQSSSTESYCGWMGWGYSWRNSYYPSYYGWNWSFYRPVYLNYGYNYGYNYGGVYPAYNNYGTGYGNGNGGSGYGYGNANGSSGYGYGNNNGSTYNGANSGNVNYYYYNQGFQNKGYSGQGWNPSTSYTGGAY